jgi:peptide/nickel transport system permease protein
VSVDIITTGSEIADHLTGADVALDEEEAKAKRLSRRALLLRRFLRNKMAVVGLGMYLLLIVLAIFGPMVIRWHYTDIDREAAAYLKPPSTRHWLGTTQAGRDVLAMSLEGLRKSMIISVAVGIGSTTIAAVVGSFAAYFGRWTERIALWVTDLLLVLPSLLIIAIFMRNINSYMTPWLIFWLAMLGWMLSARVVRSLTMSVRDREYVTAAKYMGVSGPRIIFRHILPNISSLLIIDATLAIAYAVLSETGLSFFGFGIRSPEVSLGTVIQEGSRMATTFPWVFVGGASFLVFMVVAVNFIGDGLRDAFDPGSQAGGRA